MRDPFHYPGATDDSIAAAAQWVDSVRESHEGFVCPACDRCGQVKRYRLTRSVARILCRLYRLYRTQKGPVHRREWCPGSSQGHPSAVLNFYRLITQTIQDPTKPRNRSGCWSVTKLAVRWLRGQDEGAIRTYVIALDGQRIGQSDVPLSFAEAMGVPWDPMAAYDPPRRGELDETDNE